MKNIKQKGFTLIELLIVIVILGILAVAVAPKFVDFSADAKQASAEGVEGALKAAALIGIAEIAMGRGVAQDTYPAATAAGIGAYFETDGFVPDVGTPGQYKITVQDDGAADGTAACVVTYKLIGYAPETTVNNVTSPATPATGYEVTSSPGCDK